MQIISAFDSTLDSSGLLILLSSFRWRRWNFGSLILLEMMLIAIISPLLSFFVDWDGKLGVFLAINCFFSMLTYLMNPFNNMDDRWLDHLGRTMVTFALIGLIVCGEGGSSLQETGSSPTYNTWSKSSFNIALSYDSGAGIFVLIDAVITVYVVTYSTFVLYRSGAFSIFHRFVRGTRYSFDVSVLNFLVRKLKERVVGAESLSVGMAVARQWDDMVAYQRQRYFLCSPDVQPPYLLNAFEKYYFIQLAAIFNLRIDRLKSNLGLNLLHVSMSEGESDVCRWLIYKYPRLINQENHERDTPVMIAIKETAKHLFEYSLLSNGVLDDGTSYDDDYFNEIYPDFDGIREESRFRGEFIPEKMSTHCLTAKELNVIQFEKRHLNFEHKEQGNLLYAADSKAWNKVRYPEDGINEDKDSGSLLCWDVLGIEVPATVIYEDGDQADSTGDKIEFHGFLDIGTAKIHKSDPRYVIKRRHPLRRQLRDWDSRHSTSGEDSIGKPGWLKFQWTSDPKQAADESYTKAAREQNCRMSICKYADILMSKETTAAMHKIEWDAARFHSLSQMANRIQGRLVQHLAFAFNLNPPEGFVHVNEWSAEMSRDEFVEGAGEEGNAIVKSVLAVGQAIENLESNLTAVGQRIKRLLVRQKARSHVQMFNDRVIQYLAECFVSASECINLDGNQLSMQGRVAWRAICRALRRTYCSFILPSVFVSQRQITLTRISLKFNSLDCADCLLLSEVIKRQRNLRYLDASYNRIGSRGLLLLLSGIRGHRQLSTLKLSHNRIGPAVGADLELFLSENRSIKILDLSHNRLGKLVRYSTNLSVESISSAGPFIFRGLRNNNSLLHLDISYNNLGESSFAEDKERCFIQGNTCLESLILSGNDLGPVFGPKIVLSLAGWSFRKDRDKESNSAGTYTPEGHELNGKRAHSHLRSNLRALIIANNQLGPEAGSAFAVLIKSVKHLHVLDISGNAVGSVGGMQIAEALKVGLQVREREIAIALSGQPPASNLEISNARVCSMHTLRMSRCTLGPNVLAALMECVAAPNSTIVDLIVSDNPFGVSSHSTGSSDAAGKAAEVALARNKCLRILDMSRSLLQPSQLVPSLGGVARNMTITKLSLTDMFFDSTVCLQVARVIEFCSSLRDINLRNCRMGPKGGILVGKAIESAASRLVTIDLSNNRIGSLACVPIGRSMGNTSCTIRSLFLQSNDLCDDGVIVIAKALLKNSSLLDLDLADNGMTSVSAEHMATSLRGKYENGRKVADIPLRRIVLNNNPLIGGKGANEIVASLSSGLLEHVEVENIGMGEESTNLLAKGLRDHTVRWRHLNCAENAFGRTGLNEICWSLRVNRSVREMVLRRSRAGQAFGSPQDSLGSQGISLDRMLRENIMIIALDLSYNNLSSQAGNVIFTALIANYSISRISLRGNLFDDDVHRCLGEFITANDAVKELDLGENKLGYRSCYSMAAALLQNHSIATLKADCNRFGYFKSDAFEHWSRMIAYNTTIRIMHLDDNRVGPEGGVLIAESLARNETLVQVSLKANRFDSSSGRDVVNAYRNSRVLVDLFVSEEEVGDVVWEEYLAIREAKGTLNGRFKLGDK